MVMLQMSCLNTEHKSPVFKFPSINQYLEVTEHAEWSCVPEPNGSYEAHLTSVITVL